MNGRGRDFIVQDMRRRIDRADANLEVSEIIQVRAFLFYELSRPIYVYFEIDDYFVTSD